MLKKLISLGITKDKLINLKIFDYLIEDKGKIYKNRLATKDDPVIIAGALRKHKAGYVYNLPSNVNFNLYGVGYDDSKKIILIILVHILQIIFLLNFLEVLD